LLCNFVAGTFAVRGCRSYLQQVAQQKSAMKFLYDIDITAVAYITASNVCYIIAYIIYIHYIPAIFTMIIT